MCVLCGMFMFKQFIYWFLEVGQKRFGLGMYKSKVKFLIMVGGEMYNGKWMTSP